MLDALDEAGQAVEDFYDLYTRDGLEYYLGFGEDLGDIGGESDEEGEGDCYILYIFYLTSIMYQKTKMRMKSLRKKKSSLRMISQQVMNLSKNASSNEIKTLII